MIKRSEALWAARLHVKTTVKGTPGTILDTAMILAICNALADSEERLQSAVDRDHRKALQIHEEKTSPLFTGSSPLQVVRVCECGRALGDDPTSTLFQCGMCAEKKPMFTEGLKVT
jgi:hypothetical protein